jgi:transketolase
MRKSFIGTLTELARGDTDITIISGDAGFGVFEEFCLMRPDRFINAGVAEANMIGYAAGLSLVGFNVFVYNIIPFVLYRCYEQVRNDICYQRLPVTLVGIGSGLTYAPGGMTHYGIEDLTVCQSLPNLTVISPIDPVETSAAVEYAAKADTPVYIRIAKAGEPTFRTDGCPDILEPAVVRDGAEVAVLAHGSVFEEAFRACDQLADSGIHPRLISVPTLQPFPEDGLSQLLRGCTTVITLEEHCRSGGLASRMANLLIRLRSPVQFVPLALPDQFLHDVNKQPGMRSKYMIDAASVVRVVKRALRHERTSDSHAI